MKKLISPLLLTASLMLVFSFQAVAGSVVIVNPTNSVTLTNKEIKRIFLKKAKKYPNGSAAIPINQVADTSLTSQFNKAVLHKSDNQIKSYWSKLVFTGKGTPPQEVADDNEVKSLVAANPGMIGYIDESAVDSSVQVVASF